MNAIAESSDAALPGKHAIEVPAWLHAKIEDVNGLDFEAPLSGTVTADCHEVSELYRAASQQNNASAKPLEAASSRVMTMLAAVTGMHFKPHERNEPFGAMMSLADGRRTAITSDFRTHVEVLADLAVRATNPVLRSRLSDVCWLLERNRGHLALAAISAYAEIVEKSDRNELKYPHTAHSGALTPNARDYLRRALQIGRGVGWEKPETVSVRELVKRLRQQALDIRAPVPINWFCDLDLDYSVSDPAEVAEALNGVLVKLPNDVNSHVVVELWRLAARAFHLGKREDDKQRCLAEAAEQLVVESQAKQGSAMLAAHFLSSAIAQLHGIPGKKERRAALQHQLIDMQARVPEEMSVFSHEFDLRKLVEWTQTTIGQADPIDMLFRFADLERSPDLKKLASEAVELIREHPLSSIFASSHLDREGKVIHRNPGGGMSDGGDNSAIVHQIAQGETFRRKVAAFGTIEPARHMIVDQHYLSDDMLISLLQHSPFVPTDLVATFSRGFLRFFQGDFVGAVYILTPLLENSLRHILKASGHDVTTFDDATQTQQDRTISSLFGQMRTELECILTEEIAADIERLFLSQPGPHLRHALAHGLLDDGDPYGADSIYGCWLMFRLCLLPLFPQRNR